MSKAWNTYVKSGRRTSNPLTQRNEVADTHGRAGHSAHHGPFAFVINSSGNNSRKILHRRKSNHFVLASIYYKHPAFRKVERRLESRQVRGRFIRRGEVVGEQTWLEEAVLQHLSVFVNFLEICTCCSFVQVRIEGF